MANLVINGNTYNGVNSVKIPNTNNQMEEFIQPSGTKTISANGNGINVKDKEFVDVNVSGGSTTLQSKTVTPTTSQQTVEPDQGYDGLSNVTVNAAPIQASKSVTPSSSQQTIEPDSGYLGLAQVIVGAASGGGSSVLSGSFTPSENCYTWTINDLIGTTLNHFFFKPTGDSTGPLNNSLRVAGPGFIDFTTGKTCFFLVYSASSGTSFNGFTRGTTAGGTNLSFDRETGVLTTDSGSSSGALVSGVQYDWWAW